MSYFAISTVTSDTPTAATGSVGFSVANSGLFSVGTYATVFPQGRGDTSGVTKAVQSQRILITAISGAQLTATLGQQGTTARPIAPGDVVDASPGGFDKVNGQDPFASPAALFGSNINGSYATPLALNQPNVKITRMETLPTPTNVSNGANSALLVNAEARGNSYGQANAILAQVVRATALSPYVSTQSDILAAGGVAYGTGVHDGLAIGGYFEGSQNSTAGGAVGAEHRVTNSRGVDMLFDYVTIPRGIGAWQSVGTNEAAVTRKGGLGLGFYGTTNLVAGVALWDVGIGFLPASVSKAAISDYSSSITVLKVGGTHTNIIDTLAGAANISGQIVLGYAASDLQAIFGSVGAHNAAIQIDATNAGQQSLIAFSETGGLKWQVGRDGSNNLIFYNTANSVFGAKLTAGTPGAGNTALSLLQGAGPTLSLIKYFNDGSGHNVLYF